MKYFCRPTPGNKQAFHYSTLSSIVLKSIGFLNVSLVKCLIRSVVERRSRYFYVLFHNLKSSGLGLNIGTDTMQRCVKQATDSVWEIRSVVNTCSVYFHVLFYDIYCISNTAL